MYLLGLILIATGAFTLGVVADRKITRWLSAQADEPCEHDASYSMRWRAF